MSVIPGLLSLDRTDRLALYLQISHQLMRAIQDGILSPGYRLPSTRQLSELLDIHRKTAVLAYDELLAQGWIESHVGKGTFVTKHLPISRPITLSEADNRVKEDSKVKAGFTWHPMSFEPPKYLSYYGSLNLDDGFPDPRLAPLEDLAKSYRSQLLTGNKYSKLGYGDTRGSNWLRKELAIYLNESRGLAITERNVMIVRGTIMGLYLACTAFIEKGDVAGIGATTWESARRSLQCAEAKVLDIPVDEYGIDTDALEEQCKKQTIRFLYVTSHHHYPSTVSLRSDRRMHLLRLSQEYGFIIFEDDYDYDFHYESKPLLPLASADRCGQVLYCGSFTKSIAPAFRIGYLVGPEDAIDHIQNYRRLIDRQGDVVLENTIAELLHEGVIQKHLRKSLREYKRRRDFFCQAMQDQLGDKVSFKIPEGGLAIWAGFDKSIHLPRLAAQARTEGLAFSDGQSQSLLANPQFTRLGFASSSFDELEKSVSIISRILN